jgi:hypothetical protein
MCILREQYNKIIVTRWFDEYWGENYNEGVVAELASPTIRMVPSLQRSHLQSTAMGSLRTRGVAHASDWSRSRTA